MSVSVWLEPYTSGKLADAAFFKRARASGGTAVITNIHYEDLEHQKLWTVDEILDVVCKGCEKDGEAAHMVDLWIDKAHTPILVTILEYAGLPADLRPTTLGRYNPVPEALELKHQLEDALRRGAAWYFEPPLNEEFMRQKYVALYIFHFVDEGLRFELRRNPTLQRLIPHRHLY